MDCVLKKDIIFAIIRMKGDMDIQIDENTYHKYFFRVEEIKDSDGKTYYVYLKEGTLLCDLQKNDTLYSFKLLNEFEYNVSNLIIDNNYELVIQ